MSDKPSAAAVEMAAQVWCTEATMHTPMDAVLANEFALIIDRLREENERLRKALEEIRDLHLCGSCDVDAWDIKRWTGDIARAALAATAEPKEEG